MDIMAGHHYNQTMAGITMALTIRLQTDGCFARANI
jgi:hypothetical protein